MSRAFLPFISIQEEVSDTEDDSFVQIIPKVTMQQLFVEFLDLFSLLGTIFVNLPIFSCEL